MDSTLNSAKYRVGSKMRKSAALVTTAPAGGVFPVGLFIALWVASGAFSKPLSADDLSTVRNCSKAIPAFDSSEPLTREERIMKMDQAFNESLTKFEECRLKTSAPASNASSAGGLSGDEAQEQGESGQTSATSAKSGGLSGDEPQKSLPEDASPANGKPPDDIPPAANDDAVAGQLREAAQAEQDPQKQAQLWNEYRRYKGLPEKRFLENGKPPDDIPPADNDDAVAGQLREAAQAEQDPQKQAQLWDEYRRYKGLPN